MLLAMAIAFFSAVPKVHASKSRPNARVERSPQSKHLVREKAIQNLESRNKIFNRNRSKRKYMTYTAAGLGVVSGIALTSVSFGLAAAAMGGVLGFSLAGVSNLVHGRKLKKEIAMLESEGFASPSDLLRNRRETFADWNKRAVETWEQLGIDIGKLDKDKLKTGVDLLKKEHSSIAERFKAADQGSAFDDAIKDLITLRDHVDYLSENRETTEEEFLARYDSSVKSKERNERTDGFENPPYKQMAELNGKTMNLYISGQSLTNDGHKVWFEHEFKQLAEEGLSASSDEEFASVNSKMDSLQQQIDRFTKDPTLPIEDVEK